MATDQIKFTDGAAYEKYMGVWSRLVGDAFLKWLAPKPGWRWLDVGCGSGAFSEMIAKQCAPASLDGVDPSEEQLAQARTLAATRNARFQKGDAMALPFDDNSMDAAVMPLVLFFVPQPAKGVSEMARVVCSGGVVASYSWDIPGGGFPYYIQQKEMAAMGITLPETPNPEAAKMDVLTGLWKGAGLKDVQTTAITVQRTFANIDEYWSIVRGGPSFGAKMAAMNPGDLEKLKSRLKTLLPTDAAGRITLSGRAHAAKGIVNS